MTTAGAYAETLFTMRRLAVLKKMEAELEKATAHAREHQSHVPVCMEFELHGVSAEKVHADKALETALQHGLKRKIATLAGALEPQVGAQGCLE